MKKPMIRVLVPWSAVLAAPLLADVTPQPMPAPVAPRATWEMSVEREGGTEKVVFLGIEPGEVSETLRNQVGLDEGVGLAVLRVIPGTAAEAAGLQRHDILVKFEDQLLTGERQLHVLMKRKKDGDQVKLTLLRRGKELTVEATLGLREVPKRRWETGLFVPEAPRPPEPPEPFPMAEGEDRVTWERIASREELMAAARAGAEAAKEAARVAAEQMRIAGAHARDAGERAHVELRELGERARVLAIEALRGVSQDPVVFDLGPVGITFVDDEHRLELKGAPGERVLVAKDLEGRELFNGPVNTPQDREAVPAEIRSKLERLEQNMVIDRTAPAVRERIRIVRSGSDPV